MCFIVYVRTMPFVNSANETAQWTDRTCAYCGIERCTCGRLQSCWKVQRQRERRSRPNVPTTIARRYAHESVRALDFDASKSTLILDSAHRAL